MPRPSYPSDKKPRSRQAPGRVARTIALSTEHAARLAALAREGGTTQAAVVELGIDLVAWREDERRKQDGRPYIPGAVTRAVPPPPWEGDASVPMAVVRATKGTRKKGAKP